MEGHVSRFEGRRALVTGATGGIGRAIAERLASEGASVVIAGRDDTRGIEVAERITAGGASAWYVAADLASTTGINSLASDSARLAGGYIDILVNNAAMLVPAQSMFDATEEQIDAAFAVNVKAPFLLTATLAKPMIEAGHGSVVNVGSINGSIGMSVAALYGASKAALHSLTKSFAAELAIKGVRVNTVAPGPTVTEINSAYSDALDLLSAGFADGRAGTAAEVAAAVAFLASDDAGHIHGATLPVDGGGMTTLPLPASFSA